MTAPIELTQVTKTFRAAGARRAPLYRELLRWGTTTGSERIAAVDEVSLTIERGSIVGLAGRNGAGKSTLLRLIAGIYRADSGSVKVRGPVGCLFGPKAGVMPTLSVQDNLFLNASALGLTLAETKDGFDSILEFAEMPDKRHTRLEQLSFGTAQRLFYGVMIEAIKRQKSSVYVFDEWLAGVDHRFREKGEAELLGALRDTDVVLIASHDSERLQELCSHALEMKRGKLVDFGPAERVLQGYLASKG